MEQVYFGNPLSRWLTSLIIAGFFYFLLFIGRTFLRRGLHLKAGPEKAPRNAFIATLRQIRGWYIVLLSLYLGSRGLELSGRAALVVNNLFTIGTIFQVGLLAGAFITRDRLARLRGGAVNPVALNLIVIILKSVLWIAVILLCLDNLGIQITTLIAGLGIGGIAIALAVQNILGDLLGSLTIALDKPFEEGDAIGIDDLGGTVERVGIKTTHVRSFSGEQLVFSNGDLLRSRIKNYKRLSERRVLFSFGVPLETPPEKLKRVKEIVKQAIDGKPSSRFDRCHFFRVGNSSLDFEILYWMTTDNYGVYMDTHEAVLLAICDGLAAEEMGFAYPTQRVLQHDEDSPPEEKA